MTPWTVVHQFPLSMGFSRQEYWSGLPCPLPGDLPNPGIKPRSPALQADSLPAEPQGKPKDTGVGSLSLLQQIFLTQELNQCLLRLLHCRRILYPLSHLGSPLLSFNSFQILLFLGCLPWSEDGGRTKHRHAVTPQGDGTAVSS